MELLINSFIVSLFCVGLRIATSDDMILHFMRTPYEKLINYPNPTKLTTFLVYLLKPIIGCVTCMSSVWGIVISHFYLNGINKWTILLIFVSASLSSIIYAAYEKLNTCKV